MLTNVECVSLTGPTITRAASATNFLTITKKDDDEMVTTVKLSDVESEIERMRATLLPDASRTDQRGVTARAMIAILPGTIRWSASEFNSSTPFSEVLIALASLVSNALASEIANVEVDDDEAVDCINTFLRMVATGSHQVLTRPRNSENSAIIKSSEGGNA